MMVKFSAKAQGRSHIEKNIPCQDAANAAVWGEPDSAAGIACVADGHGGSRHFRSQTGSALAVKIAMGALPAWFGRVTGRKKPASGEQDTREIKGLLKQLEGNIIYQWRRDVLDDLSKNPLTEVEREICKSNNIDPDEDAGLVPAYGTTLLAALVSGAFWFAIQIGDGLCVVLENSGAGFPLPEDERLAFGRTTSLCDSDAIRNFREALGFDQIRGITLATDGVADSFEPEKYLQFSTNLLESFARTPEKAEEDLREFLPELSKRGSGDDVAIAGLFRTGEGNG